MAKLDQVDADITEWDTGQPKVDVELEKKQTAFLTRYCFHYQVADATKALLELFEHIRQNR